MTAKVMDYAAIKVTTTRSDCTYPSILMTLCSSRPAVNADAKSASPAFLLIDRYSPTRAYPRLYSKTHPFEAISCFRREVEILYQVQHVKGTKDFVAPLE